MKKGKATLSFISCQHYSAPIPFCNGFIRRIFNLPDPQPSIKAKSSQSIPQLHHEYHLSHRQIDDKTNTQHSSSPMPRR